MQGKISDMPTSLQVSALFPAFFVGILRGGNSATISQITPSVNKSLVISSEIFPFEKTVLMDRIRKDFGKGGVRANKTNSVPRKN